MAKLLLYVQQAMLGRVKKNLRRLYLQTDETAKTIDFFLIYDGPILGEDKDLANEVIEEAAKPFKAYQVDRHLERVDYPQRPPQYGKRAAYARYEDASKYL